MINESSTQEYGKPIPLADRDSAPYWSYLLKHEFRVQRCGECSQLRWPARDVCAQCSSLDFDWTEVSGRGRVVSWTIVHHLTAPGFKGDLPYNVAAIQLDEVSDVVVVGNVAPGNEPLEVGMLVRSCFDDVAEGLTLLRWVPTE